MLLHKEQKAKASLIDCSPISAADQKMQNVQNKFSIINAHKVA